MKKARTVSNKGRTRAKKRELEEFLKRPEVESWRALMASFQKIYRTLERELLKENCSISRFQILFLIYFHGPLAATDIAAQLCVTRGNVSTFLRRLELDHLIISSQPEGRGGKELIDLTEKGARWFEKIFPPHIERVTKIMPPLSRQFLSTLAKLLKS